MGKTHKATVVVAAREGGHGGWYDGGRFWRSGEQHEAELTEEEINSLARRPGVVVIVNGKPVKPTDKVGPSTTAVPLTSDELAVVEEHRRKRATMAEAEEAASSSGGGLEFADKAPSSSSSGGAVGMTADTPLQDADILRGKTPEAKTTSYEPSKGKHK